MNELTQAKHRLALWFDRANIDGISISALLHKMAGMKGCHYKMMSNIVELVLDEWKQLAGVPVISVFERVDRMPAEVREALTKYIIKLESSN